MDIVPIIDEGFRGGASDVLLKCGKAPAFRIHGRVRVTELPPIESAAMEAMLDRLLRPEQRDAFDAHHEMDMAFDVPGICRVRANFYRQRGLLASCFRLVPYEVIPLEKLGLPRVVRDLAAQRQGLVLVTGPTGSGKSTTLAAMVDLINRHRSCNIITIEDPIEFLHEDDQAHITQREVGIDTDTFTAALRRIVRQSPDVILIGEMRDLETMVVALQASETGHLVLSTLHTVSAAETIERIINLFPPHERQQICLRLASSLRGVLSQKLLPRADDTGRIAAAEVMVATPTVTKMVLEGKTGEIYTAIQGGEFYGMQTLNQCLNRYVRTGLVTEEEAFHATTQAGELKLLLRK